MSLQKSKKSSLILIILIAALIAVNQYIIIDIGQSLGISSFKIFNAQAKLDLTGDATKDAQTIILSKGVPDIYGSELGVEFVGPSQSSLMNQMINKLKQFDPTYGKNKIVLEGDLKQRYIDIGSKIACEFCCGAKTIVFKDGEAACGCAHSGSMRGLSAYLLQNHANEYTNDEILRELAKWKGLFFPKQMMKKYITQIQTGNFTPDISALLLDLDKEKLLKNIDSADIPLPSEIEDLPGMVGGC